jgi:hypothetical protein
VEVLEENKSLFIHLDLEINLGEKFGAIGDSVKGSFALHFLLTSSTLPQSISGSVASRHSRVIWSGF